MFRLINSQLQAHSLPVNNRPEDEYLLVETCSLHITLCNKNSYADIQISITVRIQALRDVFIQILISHTRTTLFINA